MLLSLEVITGGSDARLDMSPVGASFPSLVAFKRYAVRVLPELAGRSALKGRCLAQVHLLPDLMEGATLLLGLYHLASCGQPGNESYIGGQQLGLGDLSDLLLI